MRALAQGDILKVTATGYGEISKKATAVEFDALSDKLHEAAGQKALEILIGSKALAIGPTRYTRETTVSGWRSVTVSVNAYVDGEVYRDNVSVEI